MGLAAALPAGEGLAAIFALWLLRRALKDRRQSAAGSDCEA